MEEHNLFFALLTDDRFKELEEESDYASLDEAATGNYIKETDNVFCLGKEEAMPDLDIEILQVIDYADLKDVSRILASLVTKYGTEEEVKRFTDTVEKYKQDNSNNAIKQELTVMMYSKVK